MRYTQLEPEERRLPQAAEDYAIWYLSRLRCVEQALEGKPDDAFFLVANRFTIADVVTAYALLLGTTLGLDERYKPNTKKYLDLMMSRDGFQRARQRQAE